MTPRPYQKKAVQKTNRLLNAGRHPLIVQGAGTGKTIIGIELIKDRVSLKKRMLVLVPQDLILNQWISECSKNKIHYGYVAPGPNGQAASIVGKGRAVYICMYQSLSSLLEVLPEKFVDSFSEIIIDEAHHIAAMSFRNIVLKTFPDCLRIGLTASPYRGDNQPLGEFFTDMITPIKNSEAIKKGYLCEPVIIIPEEYKKYIPDDPENVNKTEQRELIKDKQIIGDTVKTYGEVFDGLPIIAPCTTFKQAKIISNIYRAAGWKVDHIHSELDKHERRRIIKRVNGGETNILASVGIGVEGMDIPGLFGIIWFRFTESLQIWIQFNGRAARPMKGKKFYVLVDPVGNSVLHGRPDIDRKWSLDTGYVPGQEAPEGTTAKICPVCSVSNSPENNACWICGYDFITGLIDGEPVTKKKRKLPKMIDGELVYLDGDQEREGLINKDINILTEGEDGNNLGITGGSSDRTNIDNSGESGRNISDTTREPIELTRVGKVEILKKGLTGFGRKSKFKDGVEGWL